MQRDAHSQATGPSVMHSPASINMMHIAEVWGLITFMTDFVRTGDSMLKTLHFGSWPTLDKPSHRVLVILLLVGRPLLMCRLLRHFILIAKIAE